MECQILFPGKNEKNITSLSSAEYVQRAVKVKSYRDNEGEIMKVSVQ